MPKTTKTVPALAIISNNGNKEREKDKENTEICGFDPPLILKWVKNVKLLKLLKRLTKKKRIGISLEKKETRNMLYKKSVKSTTSHHTFRCVLST